MQDLLTTQSNVALALDIGGSHATAAAIDLERRQPIEGTVIRQSIPFSASADELVNAWAELALSASDGRARALGVAIPGPFDYVNGISWAEHKFSALYHRNVGEMLRRRLPGMEIAFGNDAALFTVGEQWAGQAQRYRRLIGITIGTGLGAALVDRGRIVDGEEPVTSESLWCQPYHGHIAEDFISARGVERIYLDIADRWLEARDIAKLAWNGDERALLAWAEFGGHLGAILEPHVESLKPEAVVIGGNVSRSIGYFSPTMGLGVPVVASGLLDVAALLGAAHLAANRVGVR